MFGIFRKKELVDNFWDWLAANTDRIQLTRVDPGLSQVQNEIVERFRASYPDLFWEITASSSSPWVFCVSADGNPKLLPRVEEVVRSAPAIRGWRILAFRQRDELAGKIQVNGQELGYDDIWCHIKAIDGGYSVSLFIRGLVPETKDALLRGAFVLLDNAVGEYDAVTKIKHFGYGPLPLDPQHRSDFFPLNELPRYLDELSPET